MNKCNSAESGSPGDVCLAGEVRLEGLEAVGGVEIGESHGHRIRQGGEGAAAAAKIPNPRDGEEEAEPRAPLIYTWRRWCGWGPLDSAPNEPDTRVIRHLWRGYSGAEWILVQAIGSDLRSTDGSDPLLHLDSTTLSSSPAGTTAISSSPAPSRLASQSTPMASLAIPAVHSVGTKITSTTTAKLWQRACQCACVSGSHGAELQVLGAEAEQAAVSEAPRFRWDAFGSDLTESQERAIRGLSPKLPNRCKALMTRAVCLSPGDENLGPLLAYWVKAMKPKRADWLLVLKELKAMESPLLTEVSQLLHISHSDS